MNFRLNLAVALAAAMTFACADKQAAIPELQEAMKPPPGKIVLGLFRMDVTPVAGSNGRQFYMQPVPVRIDGNANTNPLGSVQVFGTFAAAATTVNPGNCNGVYALTAPVEIGNAGVDPLNNVWAEIVAPFNTGLTACNSSLYTRDVLNDGQNTVGQGYGAANMNTGIWWYGAAPIAGIAAVPPTGNPTIVGRALPANVPETGGVWGLRYADVPARIYFRVVADNNAPLLNPVLALPPATALTWKSMTSINNNIQICSVDPALTGGTCPAPNLTSAPVTGTLVPAPGTGWNFSYLPAGLANGVTYHWRVANVYAGGTGVYSPWDLFTYASALPVQVAPFSYLANGPVSGRVLTWTADTVWPATWLTFCKGGCPAVRPAPPLPANVVYDAAVLRNAGGTFSVNINAFLTRDIATANTYLSTTATYDVRLYNYDQATAVAYASPHTTATIHVTPVQLAPVVTPTPTYSLAISTWPVTWTADTTITSTTILGCIGTCAAPFGWTTPQAGTVVLGPPFSFDLWPGVNTQYGLTNLLITDTIEYIVYNTDLFGIVPTTGIVHTISL